MTDYISRADAIEAIPDTTADMFENCRYCKLLDREQVIDILSALPSADDIKKKQIEVGAVADGIVGYETIKKSAERYKTEPSDKGGDAKMSPLQKPSTTPMQQSPNNGADLISRADVLKYPIRLDHYDEVNGSREFVYGVESVIEYVESLPSADAVEVDRTSEWVAVRREEYEDLIADAVPIVIRAKTFLRKEDFDKWAEDIKKQNKSIVCIPCDAEVVSADAVQGEWKHTITWQPYCSNCEYVFGEDEEFSPFWKYCPMCGARMKGGAE